MGLFRAELQELEDDCDLGILVLRREDATIDIKNGFSFSYCSLPHLQLGQYDLSINPERLEVRDGQGHLAVFVYRDGKWHAVVSAAKIAKRALVTAAALCGAFGIAQWLGLSDEILALAGRVVGA